MCRARIAETRCEPLAVDSTLKKERTVCMHVCVCVCLHSWRREDIFDKTGAEAEGTEEMCALAVDMCPMGNDERSSDPCAACLPVASRTKVHVPARTRVNMLGASARGMSSAGRRLRCLEMRGLLMKQVRSAIKVR